jgi:serine protease Do
MFRKLFTFLARILIASSALPASAQVAGASRAAAALTDLSSSIEALAFKASPAVVRISVHVRAPLEGESSKAGFLANQEATGSGVIVASDGYIMTNNHVVQGSHRIDVSVRTGSSTDPMEDHAHYQAKVLGVDPESDLALLKIDAKDLPTLSFFDSDQLRQGQLVVALGSPRGLENSLTVGFISAPVRHLRPNNPMFYVQTDAAINPGNSGGPLLDTMGRIVGINTLILSESGGSEGIGFAIPSNTVERVYKQLRKDGRVKRGIIGVIPEDITPVLAGALGIEHHSGVILSDVTPGSPAEAAGLAQGDVVRSIDGKPIHDALQLGEALSRHSVGDQISMDVERAKKKLQVKVSVLEGPRSAASLTELANDDDNLVRELGILALTLDEKVSDILSKLRRLSGVVVAAIPTEFAGANPGLLTGDAIYELNGTRLYSLDDLRKALASKHMHDPIALLVEREGRLIYVTLELE